MELLAQIPLIGGTLTFLVPFLAVLSIVVFVHEFGHYIVGRWCGIRAEIFSIGFGKPLLKWTDRHGTRWQVALVPLGGFVKFVGDMDPASAGRVDDDLLTKDEQTAAFHNAKLWRRVLTVAAGPVANFVLSVVLFAGLLWWQGMPSKEPVIGSISADAAEGIGIEAGDRVLSIAGNETKSFEDLFLAMTRSGGVPLSAMIERGGEIREVSVRYISVPRITDVKRGTPAGKAGLQVGDVILTIDGEPLVSHRDLHVLSASRIPGAEIAVEVERDGSRIVFRFVPEILKRPHPTTGIETLLPTMGVGAPTFNGVGPRIDAVPVHQAFAYGAERTWGIIALTLGYVRDMAFNGADTSQLGGPIRIAEVSGDAAAHGFSSLIALIAILSTSIGLINLFPIPILDGGHLMFYLVELVRGRPVGETSMKVGTMIGLSMVLLLMVFATYNDFLRL